MPALQLATNHKAVTRYYQDLKQYSILHTTREGTVRAAFHALLDHCARQFHWTLVAEYPLHRAQKHPLSVDGALLDIWALPHGYWEAKDSEDDLDLEAKKKLEKGYPNSNILFQAPDRAILYQRGKRVCDEDIRDPTALVQVLKDFFSYEPPAYGQWERAVEEFKTTVPELAASLLKLIENERKRNALFVQAFETFCRTCRAAINPELSDRAVEEMLIQHILTERIIRKVFDNPDFFRRNVVASDIERVVDALTSRSFNRQTFLKDLDRFYGAIEATAASISSFSEKQSFLNTIYEKFFQGFSARVADTHGIVYTPQPIVQFMVKSIDKLLKSEFGTSIAHKGVQILDPFVGTGNFLLQVLRQIPAAKLPQKYEKELHANEVMLLPYYVASMGIEHEYADITGEYKPFDGLCLVDTFELAENRQLPVFTTENTKRVERQRKSPIFVVVGNPPYNANQISENDNNKNRSYAVVDGRIRSTYAKSSSAKLKNKLYDPYVKAFRWATDRIGTDGIVCFVTNNSFVVDPPPFDGVRKHLANDFNLVYHLDLHGNIRQNTKLSGTAHNVFGIQVGVGITIAIRNSRRKGFKVFYHRVPDDWRREHKLDWLNSTGDLDAVDWSSLTPDSAGNWVVPKGAKSFARGIPLESDDESVSIFRRNGPGAKSNRDEVVYSFSKKNLEHRIRAFIDTYNGEVDRFLRASKTTEVDVDEFVNPSKLQWSSGLKAKLRSGRYATFNSSRIRTCLYRPFTKMYLYFDEVLNDRPGISRNAFPDHNAEEKNLALYCTSHTQIPFSSLAINSIANEAAGGRAGQCYPLFLYEKGKKVSNISDAALNQFQEKYGPKIQAEDIFYYILGLLHHEGYRKQYAEHLKRAPARIPLAEDFKAFSRVGKRLLEIYTQYDQLDPFPIELTGHVSSVEPAGQLSLSKDGMTVLANGKPWIIGIPQESSKFTIGRRSPLQWVIAQHQPIEFEVFDGNSLISAKAVSTLIGQVVRATIELQDAIAQLPQAKW